MTDLVLQTSLDHLPEEDRRRLRAIGEAIHALAPGSLLLLFGSTARGKPVRDYETGYMSDYDLLLVVETPELADDVQLWNRAWERAATVAEGVPVQLIAHDVRFVNQELRQCNYFFVDIVHEGRVLYDDRRFTLARPKALSREELLQLAKLNFEHWFESAGVFFRNCRFCEVQGRMAEAAFLLHQAAERYHHALLLVYTAYKPPTHDLNDLGQRIEAVAPEVAGALPRKGTAEDERLFKLLRSAYIDARYKKSFRISGEELKAIQERVLALAERIRAACVEQMGKLGGEVDGLRAALPKVPEREERILAELPVPTEPAELEAWKRELVARAGAEGRQQGALEGEIRGRAEGALEGRRQALFAVLTGRGLAISGAVRERIAGCCDETVLQRWLVRAGTAGSAEEVLQE